MSTKRTLCAGGTLSCSVQGPSLWSFSLFLLVNCMKETTSGISISYGKQMHIHNTIHLYSDGCIGWYRAVKERTSVEVLCSGVKYKIGPVPRLIPSRQELTVDQQARLCSHIGFTGDNDSSSALREASGDAPLNQI